jgi:NAD(P)-dependent dehydrogenase (short-subunit alcohol dehydrogenase family)
MAPLLQDKVVLVSGAVGGIGQAISSTSLRRARQWHSITWRNLTRSQKPC